MYEMHVPARGRRVIAGAVALLAFANGAARAQESGQYGDAADLTDHAAVLGKWGIEARNIGTFQRTLGQEAGCESSCPVRINALGVRRWFTPDLAFGAGLAFGMGGGRSRVMGAKQSWDTYFGVGPALASTLVLQDWRHVTVGLTPQAEAIVFRPSGSGGTTYLFNLRALVEAEVHLGILGLPSLSIALATGLEASLLTASKDRRVSTEGDTALKWSAGVRVPASLWDLLGHAQFRYYF